MKRKYQRRANHEVIIFPNEIIIFPVKNISKHYSPLDGTDHGVVDFLKYKYFQMRCTHNEEIIENFEEIFGLLKKYLKKCEEILEN